MPQATPHTKASPAKGRTAAHKPRKAGAKQPGMQWISGGTFRMGSDRHYPEEAPVHQVSVDGFWIDTTAVTNRQFGAFVQATGYVTLAERPPRAEDYPDADPALLVPASSVFRQPSKPVSLQDPYQWWAYVPGADWQHPYGPGSTLAGKLRYPVVHIAYEDAAAYAAWAGKELATEAEWEFAARGGLDGAEFAWGDELTPGGQHLANTWQGTFPIQNEQLDGFAGPAPVGSFPANGYGLYDMIGNVWEWTADWYQPHQALPVCGCGCAAANPRGGDQASSIDPRMPDMPIPRRVMKGGSHLCALNYCFRYRPAARMAQPIDTATCHLGFRCVLRVAEPAQRGNDAA